MLQLITPDQWVRLTDVGLCKGANTGEFIITAGMAINFSAEGAPYTINSLEEEVGYCLRSANIFITSQGKTLQDIVKMTMFVQEPEYIDEIKAALRKTFGENGPVLNLIVVGVASTCRCEIEVIVEI